MRFLNPQYNHIPQMFPNLHKHTYKAFHEEIDRLLKLIIEYDYEEMLGVSLLHKHTEIKSEQKYVESLNKNYLLQVTLTDDLIDKLDIAIKPYSFYFRNGQVYKFEFTSCESSVPDYKELNMEFLQRYNDILQRRDVEDIFGLRFKYKSKVLEGENLIEDNVNDLSITSSLDENREVNFDRAVQTVWSPVESSQVKCIHCTTHCGLHICVHGDDDTVIYPVLPLHEYDFAFKIYNKMRRRIYLDSFTSIVEGAEKISDRDFSKIIQPRLADSSREIKETPNI